MNVSDGNSSDVDASDSQATQLIQAALEQSPTSSSVEERDRPKSNNNLSVNSVPSSKNSATSSVHQYHFHGLAATQTQPGSDIEEDSELIPKEGSQKENFEVAGRNHGKDRQWTLPSPDWDPSSPHKFSLKDSIDKAGQSRAFGRSKMAKSNLSSITHSKNAVPHQTQNFKSTDSAPMRPEGKIRPQSSRHHNSRSHSPDFSQDSFAQGDSQLSEERLLVTSKKFTTPLADLVHTDDEDIPINIASRMGILQPNPPLRDAQKPDDRPAVILVPSTPSQSGSSDYSNSVGKSQPLHTKDDSFEQSQVVDSAVLDNDSNRGSQYSQGFDDQDEVAEVQDLYSSKRDTKFAPVHLPIPLDASVLEATQVATQEATQIPTQGAVVLTPSGVAPQTDSPTNVGPRSLLSTMDPNKRNRYQHLIQFTPHTPVSPAPHYPVEARRSGRDDAETQSTEAHDQRKATAFSPKRKSPRIQSSMSSPQKTTHQLPQGTSASDAMDVVPDSEPMREIVQTSPSKGKSMDVNEPNEKRREGWGSDSEATEASDIMPPRKFLRREEEEDQISDEAVAEKQNEEEDEGIDDEDDDDDEPLSARLRKARSKTLVVAPSKGGKTSEVARTYGSKRATKTKVSSVVKQSKLPRQQKVDRKTTSTIEKTNDSIVPSSVPNQDHSRAGKLKAAAAKKRGKRPLRKSSRAKSVKSNRSTTGVPEEDSDVEMEGVSDSEGAAESADELDEYMEPEVPSQSLKRKRGRPPKSRDRNVATITPITRLTKRLKSAGSTTSTANATRVFALWKGNKRYYPGVVSEQVGDGRYNIKFDDGAEDEVSTGDMRAYKLQAGDLVRVWPRSKDYKVHGVNQGLDIVTVEISGETEDYPMQVISILVKNIISSWHDRHIDKRSIVPATRSSDAKLSPSPSRSAASFLSAKGAPPPPKFLRGVGLIVSLSGNGTNDRTKDGQLRGDILSAVRKSGGVLVDDLFKYLRMDLSCSPNRWVGESANVQWVGEPRELRRLFLLADDCNHKPKYLMALALGIPCLSVKWLYSCLEAGKEIDWRSHLLPQGRPNSIDVQPSQQIDLNWGNQTEHLSEIMTNPVAPRILTGQSILCIGPDMMPKSKDTEKAEAASYIIRIILAMGATRVEAVRDISLTTHPLSHYDLLVIRDKEQYHTDYPEAHTVDWNWVKDSLIMSRILPKPDWPVEGELQCSQNL